MLTFFRQIRKSLVGSVQGRKYVVYAMGEILLVMIGILLALQVNNWNEWRKERIQEKRVLEGMANTLQSNLDQIRYHQDFIDRYNVSGQIILSLFESQDLDSDTLWRHFHFSLVNGASDIWLIETGYEHLRITNGEIILNENLRKEIIQLFEVEYKRLFQELSWGLKDDPETHPFIDKHFKRRPNAAMQPYDPTELYGSRIYNSLLAKGISQRRYFSLILKDVEKDTQRVLSFIKRELGDSVKE